MDIDELRTVQTRERATDGLQELRNSFYEDIAAYLGSLREKRREAAEEAADPFRSSRVVELTDEIKTAEQVAEAIYERRIGKLVKQASLAAAGMPDDQEGLTAEEQDLYDGLVDRIEQNKSVVLATLSGENAPSSSTPESDSPQELTPEAPLESGATDSSTAAAMMESESETESRAAESDSDSEESEDDGGEGTSEETPSIDRTKVRVTEDIGEIFGVDERAYNLKSDDIVHLPAENAAPLLDRDAAEKLE